MDLGGKLTKAIATIVPAALALTGCYSSYIYTTDGGCGDIVVADPYPELRVLSFTEQDAVDVVGFDAAWTLENVPEELRGNLSTGVTSTLPYGEIFKAYIIELSAELEESLGDLSYITDENVDLIIQAFDEVEPGDLVAVDSYTASYSSNPFYNLPEIAEIVGLFGEETSALAFFLSLLHPPATIVASCGEPFTTGSLDQWQGQSTEDVLRFENATSLEIYPGRDPGSIDFDSSSSTVSFAHASNQNAIPLYGSVMPIFTGFFDQAPELDALTKNMTEFELFWFYQLFWLEVQLELGLPPGIGVVNPDVQSSLAIELDTTIEDYLTNQILDILNSGSETAQTLEQLGIGELESYVVYTLFADDEGDETVFSYDYVRYYPGQDGGLVTLEVFQEEQAQQSVAQPYEGPVVSGVTPRQVSAGQAFTISGSNLQGISLVEIDGEAVEISSQGDSSIMAVLPAGLELGTKDLVITSDSGTLTAQSSLEVVIAGAAVDPTGAKSSIKKNGDSARVAVLNPVGVGKVQIMHNGKEIAWVNAVDEADPKLRGNVGSKYLVRTINLLPGKNALEVYVDGERIRRVAYTK